MLVPNGTLIMVVDGAKMSLFANRGEALAPRLEPIEHEALPTARTAELGTDRPGRRFESAGTGRGAYEGPDYHQREEDRFALEATGILNALAAHPGPRIVLVAAAQTLGVMRRHFSRELGERLIAQIGKDYAGRPAGDVAAMLVELETV